MSESISPKLSAIDNNSVLRDPSDVVIVGICADEPLRAVAAELDQMLGGAISRLIREEKISSRPGETFLSLGPAEGPSLVLWIGLGDSSDCQRGAAFENASTAIRSLTGNQHQRIIVALADHFDASDLDAIVAGTVYGLEGQAIYRSKSTTHLPEEIAFAGTSDAAIERGEILGQCINLTKRLVNEPASAIYPDSFAKVAQQVASETGLECEVWDEEKLAEENCHAIRAVGAGSEKPPRLVILKHNGGPADQPPLALVGKGVTFDSGGLSMKSSEGMVDMKCDMAGAASVLGAMQAIAKLGVRRNVIGLCGLAENMVSGSSYKLGDVIRTRSGKQIEILNTDAEGRVVLSDTLDVAIGMKPAAMVDLATLTGACMVALGKEVAGLMTNNQSVCDAISEAAGAEGEWVWQLPMYSFYDDKVKSKVADIKNVGEARWGGAITAAKFLENFVGDVPWVHMDIAGPAFADSPKPHRDAGGTGAMVRTLIRWVESQA